jgi:nucleoid DNA-binding protein
MMSLENCLVKISTDLNIDHKTTAKLYRSFWNFIYDELLRSKEVKIEGIGTFYLEEEKSDKKEPAYSLKFKADPKLIKELERS